MTKTNYQTSLIHMTSGKIKLMQTLPCRESAKQNKKTNWKMETLENTTVQKCKVIRQILLCIMWPPSYPKQELSHVCHQSPPTSFSIRRVKPWKVKL